MAKREAEAGRAAANTINQFLGYKGHFKMMSGSRVLEFTLPGNENIRVTRFPSEGISRRSFTIANKATGEVVTITREYFGLPGRRHRIDAFTQQTPINDTEGKIALTQKLVGTLDSFTSLRARQPREE